nr:MAG TPA: ankyrin repeat protein [Caudoviricetes sp.]
MYLFKNDKEIEEYAIDNDIDLINSKIDSGRNMLESILVLGGETDAKRAIVEYCVENHKELFEVDTIMMSELYDDGVIDEDIFKKIIQIIDDVYGNDWGYYKASYKIMQRAPLSYLAYIIDRLDRDFIEDQLYIGACSHGRFDIVKYLIEEKNVDPNSSDGFAAMAILKRYGAKELKYLIEKGLKIESRKNAILKRLKIYEDADDISEQEREDYKWVCQHILKE